MGHGNAQGMKEQVDEGNVDLDTALLWHLTSNHYPAIPVVMIPVAKQAIEHANLGEWEEVVQFPEGWTVRDVTEMSVSTVVEIMHLDAFIENVQFLNGWIN